MTAASKVQCVGRDFVGVDVSAREHYVYGYVPKRGERDRNTGKTDREEGRD